MIMTFEPIEHQPCNSLPILLVARWNRENHFPLTPFAPENLVSRDGFGRHVPRQPALSFFTPRLTNLSRQGCKCDIRKAVTDKLEYCVDMVQ